MVITGQGHLQAVDVTLQATSSTRSAFAIHHLRAAANAATKVHRVEQANTGAEHGEWFTELMVLVPTAIIMAGAALDANLHEVIQDILDSPAAVSNETRESLIDLKGQRTGGSLERYRKTAKILERKVDAGDVVWYDTKLFVELRNRFAHFRPAWSNDTEMDDIKLVQELRRKKVRIYPPYETVLTLPYGFITSSWAKWSVETVLSFCVAFGIQIGVPDRLTMKGRTYPLP